VGLVEFDSFRDGLHPCSNIILSANRYIRKMKGGSQSIFVRANDGRHYVVKLNDNPAGPNLLANEKMGSSIAKAVGIPVAESRGILLSESFIDSHPDLWFEHSSGVRRPQHGVHLGSQLIGETSGLERPTEYMSPSRVEEIMNREMFLGMYLLDVWANHQDRRQAIFRRSSSSKREVYFIDHGHMFGGPEWKFQNNVGSPLHFELAVYKGLWQDEQIALWISKLQSVIPEVLQSVIQDMMPRWYTGSFAELSEKLTDRLANLHELVQENASRNWPVFQQKTDGTLRLSNSGIHDLGTPNARSAVYGRLANA
jgi:hypothetical protein